MMPHEIDDCLRSFEIFVDTREHDTARSRERYSSFNCPFRKATLRYGDYCASATLPDGRQLYDTSAPVSALCVVERKMSLDELSACFTHGRERFEREFDRANEAGAKVYLLTEGGSWESIINHRYRTKFKPQAFLASLTAWSVRYNLTPLFCRAGTSGRLIREILYRDMKERLMRGEYG